MMIGSSICLGKRHLSLVSKTKVPHQSSLKRWTIGIIQRAPIQRDLGDQYYLQLGAFSQPTGAKSLQQKIDRLLSHHQLETGTRILQSEVDTLMLHKVWLGPIANEGIRDEIASLVESSDLGKPLKVDIEGESTTPMRDGN